MCKSEGGRREEKERQERREREDEREGRRERGERKKEIRRNYLLSCTFYCIQYKELIVIMVNYILPE